MTGLPIKIHLKAFCNYVFYYSIKLFAKRRAVHIITALIINMEFGKN